MAVDEVTLDDLKKRQDRLHHQLAEVRRLHESMSNNSPISSSNDARITVNAGGVGVWISTTCCFVMLGVVIVSAAWVSREFNRIDAQFVQVQNTDQVQDAYINKLRSQQQESK